MGIMEITNTKSVIKYIIFAGIIYSVLKIVPTKQLTVVEISSLVCVILVGIYSLECLTNKNKVENMTDIRENMDNNDPKLFDLDMDIDLDFNKSTGVKENLDHSGANKSEDSLADMFKENNEEEENLPPSRKDRKDTRDRKDRKDTRDRRDIKDRK